MDHCDCFVHTVAVGGCNFLYPGGFYSFTACSSHNKCSYPDYKREKSIWRLNNKGLDISPFVQSEISRTTDSVLPVFILYSKLSDYLFQRFS